MPNTDTQSFQAALELIATANNLDDLCRQGVISLIDILDFDRCGILLYDAEKDLKVGTWGTSKEGKVISEHHLFSKVHDNEIKSPEDADRGILIYQNHEVYSDNVAVGRGWLLQCGVFDEQNILGWLFIDNLIHQKPITEDEIQIIRMFGTVFGQLIVRYEHERRLRNKNKQLKDAFEQIESSNSLLYEGDKMASLGTLVKGISHELNTPLGNALTSVSQTEHLLWVLSEQFNEGQLTKTEFEKTVGIAQDNLTVALRNISRTTNLINQFKELSDAQEVDEKMPIHLDEFLNETADFFNQAQRKNGLQFKIDVHEQCRTLNVYLGSFSRAVRHIYANAAIHAYDNSGKGKMVITATPTTITGRPFTVISFTDFGKGLDDQQLAMFFDPFFTSNRQKGAGLGTSIIYNLITHQLKGKVNVERNPEGGITVQLCLPNLPSPEAIKE